MPRRSHRILIASCALALASAPVAAADPAAGASVRLLGEQVIAHDLDFAGTTVGGLSGIDYLARTGEYVLISDDRSNKDPARYYTARIGVDERGVGPVTITGTRPFSTATGAAYPPNSVDPEEIRVDPWTGDYYWTQEGERLGAVLADPSVRIAHPDGSYAGELPIPDDERMRPGTGPRQNEGLEGATFAAGGALFMTSTEGPLLQDGPSATTTGGAIARITVQARSGPLLAQFAYPIEPVFAESRPEPGRGGNGIASILAADPLDPTKLLVLERSFAFGVGNKIRVYEADLAAATNILDAPIGAARPVAKRLVVDLDHVGLSAIDNVEGMTWGPRLPSGERTLVLVSDNNFDDGKLTQVIALAVG
ncbi:esterase-like activity of phytase family protein [Nocardia sp. NBC_00508]|uniref:esterase-like activity of phytase family protein n=1 Tax=Nocardia sp. NBC_00508 TaxID=2975992 RepID=UPI002E8161E8|nr:esterase-like activity of phytase family protein [Nocardia sp. NBC_00508]WUD63534.1 esterase-like activity of phytase family protein [Nocardia sp. NBC_00508]